ncbi:hypothetical protein [Candidatus Electronema sp. TJ]|uniref:hypothetical protein n=1 Tax=Candidatus Electronema sp. TJ TaxID=3401573 RepID=UPI003AA893A2
MRADIVNIFPDTLPKDRLLFPLVQFFVETVHTLPVENSQPGPEELPPFADALLVQGLLRFHCPAPLGAERERFLALIAELRQRPGDYAALALAGNREAESSNAIISAVQRQAGQNGLKDGDGQAAALWQARLVLKLAELAARQEEELRQSLCRIARREQEILSQLRDADGESVQDHAAQAPPDSRRTRLRLKAWRTLNSLGSPPPVGAFVTADQEAFELLLEECGGETRAVAAVPLPAILAGEDFLAKRTAFRLSASDLLADFPASFDEKAWSALLEQYYPAERHGRCRLMLHFLPSAALFGGTAEEIMLGILTQTEQR